MAHTVTLSSNELDLVMIALSAIAPSGGGSAPLTLLRKLQADTGVKLPQLSTVVCAQKTAAQEFLGDDEWMALEAEGCIPDVTFA